MAITRAKYWHEIAHDYDTTVDLLKAMLDLTKLKLKPGQRKLFPIQIKEIYRQLGNPHEPL